MFKVGDWVRFKRPYNINTEWDAQEPLEIFNINGACAEVRTVDGGRVLIRNYANETDNGIWWSLDRFYRIDDFRKAALKALICQDSK